MNFRTSILDAFQATSLILIFVTILFNLKYSVIIEDIKKDIPYGTREKREESIRLWKSFFKNCFPILFLSGASFYVLLPLATRIIMNSNLKLWNFDLLPTVYTLIVIWIGMIFCWSVLLCTKLIKKIKKIQE